MDGLYVERVGDVVDGGGTGVVEGEGEGEGQG